MKYKYPDSLMGRRQIRIPKRPKSQTGSEWAGCEVLIPAVLVAQPKGLCRLGKTGRIGSV